MQASNRGAVLSLRALVILVAVITPTILFAEFALRRPIMVRNESERPGNETLKPPEEVTI